MAGRTESVTRPAAPLGIDGMCVRCGYYAHLPSDVNYGCAVHPCHRCHHDTTTRNDGTRGYVVETYLDCRCPCHRAWRRAYDAAVESETLARYAPDDPPRGRHTVEEGDFA